MNTHIWYNETKVRRGDKDGNLHLTHGLNGIRQTASNKIMEVVGGRKDYKIECIAADFKDWDISWYYMISVVKNFICTIPERLEILKENLPKVGHIWGDYEFFVNFNKSRTFQIFWK